MLRGSRRWDVRCPRSLTNLFPQRTGYYYKVTRTQARQVCAALSRAYRIPSPLIVDCNPPKSCNGLCTSVSCNRRSMIAIHARGHIKTVFHEWYHALDHATNGKYNSSDRQGGPSSLAWQFADLLWERFRNQRADKKRRSRA